MGFSGLMRCQPQACLGQENTLFQGQEWNWLNLSCSFLLSQQQYKMPGRDTLHKESLTVEMITGASDFLGKYRLSFQPGVFRPMTCLRENNTDPHPIWENQHSPSLLQTTFSSSWPDPWLIIRRKISGVSLGNRNGREPMQSDLPALEASTMQTGLSSRQTGSCWDFYHISPTADLRQISTEPMLSPWQSRTGMSQKKPWMLPCERLKSWVS